MNRSITTKELTLSCGHKIPLKNYEGQRMVFCEKCAHQASFILRIQDGDLSVTHTMGGDVEIQDALFCDSEKWREYHVSVKIPEKGEVA